ncbi:hypothetical protein ACEN9D_06630 [Pseudomonas sp. CT11-2]|uniref:hypothetical protein n=1 Tax=Pseudomonas sp. CT11-2 TaxID=3243023 RepID=UPI0039B0AC4E
METTFKDKPDFSHASVDELRFQALEFERLIVNYIKSKSGSAPHDKAKLHNLIVNELIKYPLYPQLENYWPDFIKEVLALKEFRNSLIHSDFSNLPSVSELYKRFKDVNDVLYPFRICSGNRDRFKPIAWRGKNLEILIDENQYLLAPADLTNLMIELHPASRGKVNFIKGRLVAGKSLGYDNEKITYFIESFPAFELDEDESAVLEDMLSSLISQFMYSR